MALFVYPALLAAHFTAKRLKQARDLFELKLPGDLRVSLLAPKREHFWGSVPAFTLPVKLLPAWSIIIGVMVLGPRRQSCYIPHNCDFRCSLTPLRAED